MVAAPAPVAVVIATRNRGIELLGTLARLAALHEQPPIVVVDNGSTDGTCELVHARHPGVRVVGLRRLPGSPRPAAWGDPADELEAARTLRVLGR